MSTKPTIDPGPPSGAAPGSGPLQLLLLAGSRRGEADAVARAASVSCKAFAPAAGEPMIERVLGVLLDYSRVQAIDVALPRRAPVDAEAPRLARWAEQGRVRIVEPGDSPARTVSECLSRYPDGTEVLATTADHALLSRAIVDQFLAGCQARGVDVFAGFVPLRLLESRHPDMRRTGLRFRDGRYSGCNLFLMHNGPGTRAAASYWQRLEALRKSPLRIALAVGPAALLGYGLGLLSLAQGLQRLGDRAGAALAPVILDIPEAAIDVDTPRDLAFVETVLERAG